MRGELRDCLENLYPDSTVGETPCREMRLEVARAGTAAVHVLLTGLDAGTTVRPSLRTERGAVPEAQWFRLVDVPVERNTGPEGFLADAEHPNPDVVRPAPFRTYDALEPIGRQVKVPSPTLALRLHLPIPRAARAGERRYTLRIAAGGDILDFALTVRVYPVAITPVGTDSLPYTNWFSFALMAQRHGLEPWSEAHWRMIRRYAELMAGARQNTFWVPQADIFTVENCEPVLNVRRLRRIVKTFTEAGMYYIEGGHFGGRTTGEWKCPTFSIALTKNPATSAAGNADIACISAQLMDEIANNDWWDRWLQHVADEPITENATDYRIFTGIVRKYMPGIPILDATMEEGLEGSVDIWCPQAQQYQQEQARLESQRAVGDTIWFYTCCVPGGPWLNRLLDMELLRPLLFGWAAARYRLDGFLHWGLNHYRETQDPFQQSLAAVDGSSTLPPGDTHVVYPGNGAPWSSLRLEAQREGFEDYELLHLLGERDQPAATAIIARILRRFDDYAKDVAVLRAARRELLEALTRTKGK